MAGPATSPRRWMLPSALLVVLLAAYNESPSTSLQSNAAKSQLRKCPKCGWIERKARTRKTPRCSGTDDCPHTVAETILLEGSGHTPSDGPRRFK
jgi:hypothetical protein